MKKKIEFLKLFFKDYKTTKIIRGTYFTFFLSRIVDLSMLVLGHNSFTRRLNNVVPKRDFIIKNKIGEFSLNIKADSRRILSTWYETDLLKEFTTDDKNIYIDIGSNAGKYVVHCLKNVGYSECLSFEPNHKVLKYQKETIKLNKLEGKVKLFNFGLSDKNGEGLLNVIKDDYGISSLSPLENEYFSSGKREAIPLKKLDNIISENNINIGKINLIKIDVEGYEFEVIRGGVETLKKLSPGTKIIIEIWDHIKTKNDTLNLFETLGFVINKQFGDDFVFIKK